MDVLELRHEKRKRAAWICRAVFGVSAIWLASIATAQPISGLMQPDRLTLGTVRIGSTVEASVRVFGDVGELAGMSVSVNPPPFVTVKQTRLSTQTFGDTDKQILCDVSVLLNTENAGEYSEPLQISVGKRRFTLPISVSVVPKKTDETRVLVVETPFTGDSTDDALQFEAWLELVDSANLNCHYLEANSGQPVLRNVNLSEFDAVLLGMCGLVYFRDSDVEGLTQFLSNGGRVVVCANAFFDGTVGKANELLSLYGLQMNNVEPPGIDMDLVEIARSGISDGPFTRAVTTLSFFRPSPIAVTDKTKGRILVAAPEFPGEGYVAVGQAGKGEIVAVGISLWWGRLALDPEKESDNAVLFKNVLTK